MAVGGFDGGGLSLNGGDVGPLLTDVWLFREGNWGTGLAAAVELLLRSRLLPVVCGEIGLTGSLCRSSGLAPGMLPTLFGGGAKVLTSFTSIVAKYLGPTFSSSFFPANGTMLTSF